MEQKLYVVYGEYDCVYIVKAQNKKEAVDLAYENFGYAGELKKNFVALDLEKELFKENGLDRKAVMLI